MCSGWVSDGMVDVSGLATVDFLVNSYGLLICLVSLSEMMSISGGVEGTEVTASSFLTVSGAFLFLSFEDTNCYQVQWWIAGTAPAFLSPHHDALISAQLSPVIGLLSEQCKSWWPLPPVVCFLEEAEKGGET